MIKITVEIDEDQIKDYICSILESENYQSFNDIELILSNKKKNIIAIFKD